MTACNTKPNIAMPDDFYASLVKLYDGLDEGESLKASARLILLLANHIGDPAVLEDAIRLAAIKTEA